MNAPTLSTSNLVMSWGQGSGGVPTSYTVYVLQNGSALITLTPGNVTTTQYGLSINSPTTGSGANYSFYVTATNGSGTSPPSATSSLITYPAAPTGLTATTTQTGAPGTYTITYNWSGTFYPAGGIGSWNVILYSVIAGITTSVQNRNYSYGQLSDTYTNFVTGASYYCVVTGYSWNSQAGASSTFTSQQVSAYNPYGGPQGVQGYQGVQGAQGSAGPMGPQGPAGNPGLMQVNNYSVANQLVTTAADSVHVNTNPNLTFDGTTLTLTGNLTQAGGASLNSGALSGVTTLNTSGAIATSAGFTGPSINTNSTTLSRVSGVTLNNGAVSGVTTLNANGSIATSAGFTGPSFSATNFVTAGGGFTGPSSSTINGISIGLTNQNVSGVGTLSCGAITGSSLALGSGGITAAGALSGVTTITNGASTSITSIGTASYPVTNIYATTFTGALTGNVTGNCTGSSASCTGNAATATNVSGGSVSATSVSASTTLTATSTTAVHQLGNMVFSNNTISWIGDGGYDTGVQWVSDGIFNIMNNAVVHAQFNTSGLDMKTYPISNAGTITSTGFSGPLTGNVTGNCSGSSGSCTGNAAGLTGTPAITVGTISCGAITSTGNLGLGSNTITSGNHIPNANTNTLGTSTSNWSNVYSSTFTGGSIGNGNSTFTVNTPGGTTSVDTLTVQVGGGTVPGFAINAAGTIQAFTTVYARNADGNSNAVVQVLGNGNGAGNATAVQLGSYVRATGSTRTDIRIDAINNSDTKTIAYFDGANVRMGINTRSPAYPLDVNGTGRFFDIGSAVTNGVYIQGIGTSANPTTSRTTIAGIAMGNGSSGTGIYAFQGSNKNTNVVDLGFFTGATSAERLTIAAATGYIGINNTSPAYLLDVKGGTTAADCIRFQGANEVGGGRIVFQNTVSSNSFIMYGPNSSEQFYIYSVTSGAYIYQTTTMSSTWTVGSDRRLKNVIGPVVNSTSQLENLNPVYYTLKADPSARQLTGLIAQEVLPYYPNLVSEHTPPNTTETMYGLDYGGFITPLIASIKELSARLSNVEAQLAART